MAWPIVAAIAAGTAARLYSGYKQSEAQKEAAEKEYQSRMAAIAALRADGRLTEQEYNSLANQVQEYYQNRGSLGTKDDVNEYKAAIEGYNPEDYVYDFEKEVGTFGDNYTKTKEDFLNPYYNKIMSDTAGQVQHSAAGAGIGRGTGAALNIAKATTEKSDELYKTALQEYNQDRNQAYKEYADAITRNQERLNALREGNQYKMGLEGDLAKDYYNTQDQAMSDALKVQQDKLAAKQAYSNAISSLY